MKAVLAITFLLCTLPNLSAGPTSSLRIETEVYALPNVDAQQVLSVNRDGTEPRQLLVQARTGKLLEAGEIVSLSGNRARIAINDTVMQMDSVITLDESIDVSLEITIDNLENPDPNNAAKPAAVYSTSLNLDNGETSLAGSITLEDIDGTDRTALIFVTASFIKTVSKP